MVQVPVEGNLLERGIVETCLIVEPGRCKISNESSKARNNDTIVAEQQFPYESFNIQNKVS